MGFTRTSEGRVFFKNADNDDTPRKTSAPSEPVMPKDNTQMQMLMLLKSLNTTLKSSKEDRNLIKKQLADYKNTIKTIEDKATAHEANYKDAIKDIEKKATANEVSYKDVLKNIEGKTSASEANYIDLEQKVARKSTEAAKKSTRIENSIKSTLKHVEEAKELVAELESKHSLQDGELTELKTKLSEQKDRDKKLLLGQKSLATTQKAQGEKMVDNVAAYLALTKRMSEAETRDEALDNKIEDAETKYLKLDRKIDKAIEDRNRILRKVDRIEQAVLETRDALNAKAMVLLTDQGAVAGVNMPQINDKVLQTDPMALNRRLQEEALMPLWRKPLRIQGLSLVILILAVMFSGWLIGNLGQSNNNQAGNIGAEQRPTISLHSSNYEENTNEQSAYKPVQIDETPVYAEEVPKQAASNYQDNYGIKIHKGYGDTKPVIENMARQDLVEELDINNDREMLEAFEEDQSRVARRLNQIEPSSLTTQDRAEPPPTQKVAKIAKPAPVAVIPIKTQSKNEYIRALKRRIKPDSKLSEIAKKIEDQAFDGVPEAQHDMGAIYVAGHGLIKKDLKRAVLWFKEASNNGIANAKYNLGVLHHQGMGVKQSIEQAMSLYAEAAALGHPEAAYNLGIAYIEGIGVPYNPKLAARYFEKAADSGVIEAAYNLGLIYENGLLGDTRPDNALAWYKQAADQGSVEASSALDQLAASLAISPADINRIVEKIEAAKRLSNGNTASNDNYMISQVQKELMRRGLYPGPVDGKSGPMTEDAIKAFQRDARLDVNGQVSQTLLSYLRASK